MKNLIFIFIISFMLSSCGGIKNSLEYEVFTDSEKALFNVAVEKYKATDIGKDVYISSSVSDTLLVITGVWHATPPNPFYDYGDEYQYKFTKENGSFIVREYKNNEFFTEVSNENFTALLEEVLFIDL